MKKFQFILFFIPLSFMFACQQNTKKDSSDDVEIVDETILSDDIEEELANIDESSVKYSLLGMWQDLNDPTYKMELTANKFKNYLEGDINWNQDWELANDSNSYLGNLDDNGMFIWVFKDKGEDLYCCEIKVINENILEVKHIFGALTGSHEKFERIKIK